MTLTMRPRYGSHQSLATIPECSGSEPVSSTECPGPVSLAAWRYLAFENTAPRSMSVLRPDAVKRSEAIHEIEAHLIDRNHQDQPWGRCRRRRLAGPDRRHTARRKQGEEISAHDVPIVTSCAIINYAPFGDCPGAGRCPSGAGAPSTRLRASLSPTSTRSPRR